MKKLLIWGTGSACNKVLDVFDNGTFEIVAFIDNCSDKWGTDFRQKKVIAPSDICNYKYDIIVIISVYFEDIRNQIISDFGIDNKIIENSFYFNKCQVLTQYTFPSDDKEADEVISYLKDNPLIPFCYPFVNEYTRESITVNYDFKKKMYYVYHLNKKMYFAKYLNTENAVKDTYRALLVEQDKRSPHCYYCNEIHVEKGDIVVDIGAAEGNFALEHIDIAKKIYIIEYNEEWIEALQATFEPYIDKVIFIKTFISNRIDDQYSTIDSLFMNEKIDFIKMDIEGSEIDALRFGKAFMSKQENLKMAICAYHNIGDEAEIKQLLDELGFSHITSSGYMIFPHNGNYLNIEEPLRLVRGLIWAQNKKS